MFHTLSNVQRGEAIPLQQCIDNRKGNVLVGLRSITYWVGWYNIGNGETFQWRAAQPDSKTNTTRLEPGLYNFDLLRQVLTNNDLGLVLKVSKTNGTMSMTIPTGFEARLSMGLRSLLGLDDKGSLDAGTYLGDRPVEFAFSKALHVHLHQVSTTNNAVDGTPSTLIGLVPVPHQAFGETASAYYPHPEFRPLQEGTISELKVDIMDGHNKPLDNHGLQITVVLEFKKQQ